MEIYFKNGVEKSLAFRVFICLDHQRLFCDHLQTKIKQNMLETNSTLISTNKLCITMFWFISLGNAFYHSTIEPYLVSFVDMLMGPLIPLILVFSLFFASVFSQTWGKCIRLPSLLITPSCCLVGNFVY